MRLLTVIVCLVASAMLIAQDTDRPVPNDLQPMLLLGVGLGSSTNYQADAVSLEGRIVVDRFVLGIHYVELNETDPGSGVDPAQSVGDLSLLSGIAGNTGCGLRWSMVSGISYVGGRRRSAEVAFREVDADGTTTDHFVSDKFDTVGLPLEAVVDLLICKRFGLSAIGFANLNPVNSYVGWMIGFRWGGG